MVSYDETRLWVYWYNTFTPSQLADGMGCPVESILRHLAEMLHRGTIEDTGDYMNGDGPKEPILTFVPLPLGPTNHFTEQPEWQATPGAGGWAQKRGQMVRHKRVTSSVPSERSRQVRADERYRKAQEKRYEREERAYQRRLNKASRPS